MRLFKSTAGDVLTAGQPFELGGVAYPANFLELATAKDLKARGIVAVKVADPKPEPAAAEAVAPEPVAPAPEPVPLEPVQLWQLRSVLRARGLFDNLDEFVEGTKADEPARWEAFNMGNTVSRRWFAGLQQAAMIGLEDGQIDAIMAEARAVPN